MPLRSRLVRRAPRVLVLVALRTWEEAWPVDLGPGAREIDGATAVYGGTLGDAEPRLPASAAVGKVVVLRASGTVPLQMAVPRVLRRFPGAAAIAVGDADA